MAKLRAGKQKELFRFVKDHIIPNEDKSRLIWSKTFVAIMDSGKVLKKIQVKYAATEFRSKEELHDWGWKLIKKTSDPEKYKEALVKLGYKLL